GPVVLIDDSTASREEGCGSDGRHWGSRRCLCCVIGGHVDLGFVAAELRRRRVIRAVVLWGVVAFAVLQIFESVMHGLHLPEWTLSFVVVLLGLGFPVTVALAWVFDLTARGVERTALNEHANLRDP